MALPGIHEPSPPEDRLHLFYTLFAPDRITCIPNVLATHVGREETMYRKLEEKYGAWRFFEVWHALDAFYLAYCPPKIRSVPHLIRDWQPRGLEELLVSLENRYASRYFTDRSLIPLNDGSRYRAQIESLYRRYEPCKVDSMGTVLGAYRGYEDQLLAFLRFKYEGVDPPMLPTRASAPPAAAAAAAAAPAATPGPEQAAAAAALLAHIASTASAAPVPHTAGSVSPVRLSRPVPEAPAVPAPFVAPPSSAPGLPMPMPSAGFEELTTIEEQTGGGWVPPSQEDWLSLVAALKRKDTLIARQAAAMQEQSSALAEERVRGAGHLSAVPRLVNRGNLQDAAIAQLAGQLSVQAQENQHLQAALSSPQHQQAKDGQRPALGEVAHQVDLTALARILELKVPPDFVTVDKDAAATGGNATQQPGAPQEPQAQQAPASVHRLRQEAWDAAQKNLRTSAAVAEEATASLPTHTEDGRLLYYPHSSPIVEPRVEPATLPTLPPTGLATAGGGFCGMSPVPPPPSKRSFYINEEDI